MNVADAAHSVVHDYAGGAESLAPRVGIGAAVLRSKVNPNTQTHHLSLLEASRITGLTDDMRILHAFAAEHGRVVVKPGDADDASDMAVLEVIAAMWSTNGDLGTAVHRALADGVLTTAELALIKAAAVSHQQKIASLLHRLEAMAEPESVDA
jgi:hypothetical protein